MHFLISQKKNICCDPLLEPSHRDGSNEGSQRMFCMEKIMKEMKIIPKLSLLSFLV